MGKRGPPGFKIDLQLLGKLAGIQCPDQEIEAILDLAEGYIAHRCKRDRKFSDTIKKARHEGKGSLRRKQFAQAIEGNTTMLIWLGKQLLGQADKQEVDHSGKLNVNAIRIIHK